jgi:hypothetical protein
MMVSVYNELNENCKEVLTEYLKKEVVGETM